MDEAIYMVSKNRECHPGGKKVYLVSKDHYDANENRVLRAEHRAKIAEQAMAEMAVHFRMKVLVYCAATTAVATMAFLAGLLV